MFKLKKKFKTIFFLVAVLLFSGLAHPKTTMALGFCSLVGSPSIQLIIAGQTFTSDGSITVSPGSILSFHVNTYAEPSSPNGISYPGGSFGYPGPSGYMGPGRDYTTTAINSPSLISIWLGQNCSPDPNTIPEVYLTLSINLASSCAIQSFTCDGNATLAWSTSNCSGQSISPTVGSVSASGNTQGLVGTTYTLAAESQTAYATCPSPSLNAAWQEGGTTINKTVTPGQQITLPLNFSNTGQSGSIIKNILCNKNVSGLPGSNVYFSSECSPATITAP